MSRLRMRAAAAGVTAALAAAMTAGASGLAQASPGPGPVPLPGSAVPFTSHTPVTGYVAGRQRLTVQLWLKPDAAAAERYATAAATPGSALFHHYLSPAGYTARFGASQAAASQVGSWLRGEGFTGITADSGRAYVRATAPVSTINAAFRIRLTLYKPSAAVNAGRYRLRANNRAVSLPAPVAARVLGVSGLDNADPVLPLIRENTSPAPACSQYYGQHTVSGLPQKYGTTTFPTVGCGYTAGQVRAAYGASNASTGKGQTIALVELGLTRDMFLTLADYAKANHMPAPSSQRYAELSLGKNTCGDPSNGEEQLDVEASYDMAPGASQLVVGGDSCNNGDQGLQGVFDADTAILDGAGGHPLATIASNSWGSGGENQPASLTSIENGYLVRAAAEGVGMYFSSGDTSGVQMPSSDPYATAVGGTTLGIGASGNRLFETGWSTGAFTLTKQHTWLIIHPEVAAAGGGPSLLWREPAVARAGLPEGRGPGRADQRPRHPQRPGPQRARHQRRRRRRHRLCGGPARLPHRRRHAHLPPERHRRDQPGRPADSRHGDRGPAGPGGAVRIPQPGAVQAARHRRLPPHAAAHRSQPGAAPRRVLPRRGLPAERAGHLRRPEPEHDRVHRPGHPPRL